MEKPFDVIIIGAGCAGLSAATYLSQKGSKVCLIEKSRILGGRTSSYLDPQSGEIMDNGQHLFLGCYEETIKFLKRIGTLDQLHFSDHLETHMYGAGQERATLKTYPLAAPFHLLFGYLQYKAFSLKERFSIIHVVLGLKKYSQEQLSQMSCEDFLQRCNQSEKVCKRFWNLIILATLNISPSKAPANLLKVVLEKGFMASNKASRPGLAQTGLTQLFGDASEKFIENHGGVVLKGQSVQTIVIDKQAVQGVVLSNQKMIKASHVMCATPPDAFANLVKHQPSLKDKVLLSQKLTSTAIVSLNFWTDQKLIDTPFVGFWDTDFHWLFSKSKIIKGTTHYTLVASDADHLVGKSTKQLVEMAYQTIGCMRQEPFVIQRAKKSVSLKATYCPPLESANVRLRSQTNIKGFYLAGDWTDTGLPCTIEGAVLSGHRAGLFLSQNL